MVGKDVNFASCALPQKRFYILKKKKLNYFSLLYKLKNIIKISTNVQSSIPWSSEKFIGCPDCNTLQLSSICSISDLMELSTALWWLFWDRELVQLQDIWEQNLLFMEISRTNACFKDRMHQCMEAFQYFKPGTREQWAGSGGNPLNTENKRKKLLFTQRLILAWVEDMKKCPTTYRKEQRWQEPAGAGFS